MNSSVLRPATRRSQRLVVALVALPLAVLGLAACGPKGNSAASESQASAKVQAIQSDPNVQAAEISLQKQFQDCSATNTLWTKEGRTNFVTCIAPNGKKDAIKACLQAAATKDGVLTKTQRQAFQADALKCVSA